MGGIAQKQNIVIQHVMFKLSLFNACPLYEKILNDEYMIFPCSNIWKAELKVIIFIIKATIHILVEAMNDSLLLMQQGWMALIQNNILAHVFPDI